MRSRTAILAAMLAIAPSAAQAADLVVWWEKGYYDQEDEAVEEIVAAFEQDGKKVELVLQQETELPAKIVAALAAGRPPDFAFGSILLYFYLIEWALEDRLVDLSDAAGSFLNLFDSNALDRAVWLNARTGQKALYGLPIGRTTNLVHIWKSLLESSDFTLDDIPAEWEAFWSFWCDEVQPAVRQATGRDDIWGVGLPMSAEAGDTMTQFFQFIAAYQADYVSHDGRLIIDDPQIRRRLVETIDSYSAIYRKGCTPPESVSWTNIDNNKAFLAQTVLMTPNDTLSIPNALKRERPDDYHKNISTIDWPLDRHGQPFPIMGYVFPAVVFKEGGNVGTAKEFVRFLGSEGWLAHYLNFSAERYQPPMSALREQPFWLDPSDPHRMAAVMQISLRPMAHDYTTVTGDWRHVRVEQERVWAKAIHRIVTENITPEQAVDDAIARIKEILTE